MESKALEDAYQLPTYGKFPFVLVRSSGAYVWDESGKKYLDFYGGHAVVLTGHSRPEIARAVYHQMRTMAFYSNVVYNPARAKAARDIVRYVGTPFTSVFLCNSGTEANETALKIAKKHTGKTEVISFHGSFHGRTIGALSVTGIDSYKKNVGRLVPGVSFATLGDVSSVGRLMTKQTAAVIVEPVQSIAGVIEASVDFYRELRLSCDKRGVVLIFDEVQCGLGRCGASYYGKAMRVTPDIITFAKGLGGGLPAGAVLVQAGIAKCVEKGDQGTTFGGGPIVASAISETLGIITREKLASNAAHTGAALAHAIRALPHVRSVRGRGLLLGIEFALPAKRVQTQLLERGIITGESKDPRVLRLMPPLTIGQKEVKIFLQELAIVLNDL